MPNDAEKILLSYLDKLQKSARVRKSLAAGLVLALVGAIGYFAYDLMPRSYFLTITGGDILSNRHFVAKSLQAEAASSGITLSVKATKGSIEALDLVDAGKLDLAFIQGGLDAHHRGVVHVATVAPELLHFLVRPDIKEIAQLRGKVINLGTKNGGTRVVATQVLRFSGLVEGIDYAETNYGSEQLIAMRRNKLPDVLVFTSFVPSHVVDYLVKQQGFSILEMPFPAALALRLGWVADTTILAYMYNVVPPVPSTNIKTIGVNLHLVANRTVEPRAINKVLETLFSPAMESRLRMKMDENRLTIPSGYELSEGTKMFMARNDPIFSARTLDKLKALFGLIMSIASTMLILVNWFKGEPTKPVTDDEVFIGYIGRVAAIEKQVGEFELQRNLTPDIATELQAGLTAIKAEATKRLSGAKLDNQQLVQSLLLAIADARASIGSARLASDAGIAVRSAAP